MNRRSWAWWAYSAALLALGYGRMVERLASESGGFASRFGPPISATLLAMGVTCWLRSRGLVSVWFWRAVHLALGLGQVVGLVFAIYLLTQSVYSAAGLVLGAAALSVPAFYALHHYSYRSADVWRDDPPPPGQPSSRRD